VLPASGLLTDLHHPNVLRVYAFVSPDAPASPPGAAPPPPPSPPGAPVAGVVMERAGGGPLSAFLAAGRGPLPLRLRAELALQAANGLAYLHELGVAHLGVRPSNLLLDGPPPLVAAAARAGERGGGGGGGGGDALAAAVDAGWAPVLKVADFWQRPQPLRRGGGGGGGIGLQRGGSLAASGSLTADGDSLPSASSLLRSGSLAASGGLLSSGSCASSAAAGIAVAGDPAAAAAAGAPAHAYAAPELVAGGWDGSASDRADVWSLGVVMLQMVTREVPYQGLPPERVLAGLAAGSLRLEVPPSCEPEWAGLLEACLDPVPGARPSMRHLAHQLEAVREHAAAAAGAAPAAAAAGL
jgi:serine/threonine protein kinase